MLPQCCSNYTDKFPNTRRYVSYEARAQLPPHETIKCMLMNIFHGNTSELKTWWIDGKREVEDMARSNLMRTGDEIYIDGEWLNNIHLKTEPNGIDGFIEKMMNFQFEVYMEETKQIALEGASGHTWFQRWIRTNRIELFSETLSNPSNSPILSLEESRKPKVKIVIGSTVYYIVGFQRSEQSIWFLLCMKTNSSDFEKEEVLFVKVMSGKGINSKLSKSVETKDTKVAKDVVFAELRGIEGEQGDSIVTFL